jgi:SAM-dependent methyltransferase
MTDRAFSFACPICHALLVEREPGCLHCPEDGLLYQQVNGIWYFLRPERCAYFAQFIQEYEAVRRAEGRGSMRPDFYRALPYQDLSGNFSSDWRIRARSFDALLRQIIVPREKSGGRSLKILDLGAGNGWLSNRLAARGHVLAAVDLMTNVFDGLGAHVHYTTDFIPVQAEFSHLPFAETQVDLAIFNASLHYAEDYERVIAEAIRTLKLDGQVIILDSPVYRDPGSGAQMVREREAYFTENFGFPSNSIQSEHYLTHARLERLADALGLQWQIYQPFYGWRWVLKPLRMRLRRRREPAQFFLIIGSRNI